MTRLQASVTSEDVGHALGGLARLRVVVSSEHALVSESVRTALTDRAYLASVVAWPPRSAAGRIARARAGRLDARLPGADVGVLLSGAYRADRVASARGVIETSSIPWLVLSDAPRGPIWGAFYESGAALVAPMTTTLGSVCELLEVLADDRPGCAPAGRSELVMSWRSFLERREEISIRLASLTPREHEVLGSLYDGLQVRDIAGGSDVAEATVRTQVKAILKKLDVSTQLAAVSAYAQILVDGT